MRQKNWYLTIGTILTVCMLAFTVLGLFWTPYAPSAMSAAARSAPPSPAHLFGCDAYGRDIFSRTLEGAGSTLTIALAVLAVGAACGLAVGALCGYYGGPADALIMRLCDAVAAFPSVLLALVVLAHYIQLTQLSSEAVELKEELASLQTENAVLTAQYEQMFDLASVREAAEAMGMTKPSSSQIYYIDLTEGDSAVVYQEANPGPWDKIRSSLRRGMYAAMEYFD